MTIPSPQLPPTNFLVDLIPSGKRKQVYALFGLIGLLLVLANGIVALVSQGLPPTWLIILAFVHNLASPFFSALATANVVPVGEEAAEIEAGEPGNIHDTELGAVDEDETEFDSAMGSEIDTEVNAEDEAE